MIILNYDEHYGILKFDGFEKFSNIRDLLIMATQKEKEGKNAEEIKQELIDFCKEKDKNFNLMRETKKIDMVLQKNRKKLRELQEVVNFSENEIKILKSLENYEEQKFLYVLMVICKTYSTDSIFLNAKSPIKIKDILQLAKINSSVVKGENILHSLYEKKLITVLPNLKYTVLALDNESLQIAYSAKPSLNCLNEYEVYNGNGIWCKNCGAFVKRRSNNTKYCPSCAKEVKKIQDIVRQQGLSKVEKH